MLPLKIFQVDGLTLFYESDPFPDLIKDADRNPWWLYSALGLPTICDNASFNDIAPCKPARNALQRHLSPGPVRLSTSDQLMPSPLQKLQEYAVSKRQDQILIRTVLTLCEKDDRISRSVYNSDNETITEDAGST